MLSANLSAIFYLISGIFYSCVKRTIFSRYIETRKLFRNSRNDNCYYSYILICWKFFNIINLCNCFLIIGGSIGAFIAFKIPMTAMPELVASFHSLVGLAAVFVAIAAFLNPVAFNLGMVGNIKLASLIEMSIGAAVGAITFSGSIIAFLKLRGINVWRSNYFFFMDSII